MAGPAIHLGPTQPATAGISTTPAATDDAPPGTLAIPFAKNKGEFELTGDELQWCERARARLLTHPEAVLVVTGHTDADGDPEWNRRLSRHRAELVMARLVEAGIPADRIAARGAGAESPLTPDLTSKDKARNRRVEIHLEPAYPAASQHDVTP